MQKYGLSHGEEAVLSALRYVSTGGIWVGSYAALSRLACFSSRVTLRRTVYRLVNEGLILIEEKGHKTVFVIVQNETQNVQNETRNVQNEPSIVQNDKERKKKNQKEIKKEEKKGEKIIYNNAQSAKAPELNFKKEDITPSERPTSKEVWQTALKYKDNLRFARNDAFVRDMEDFFLNEDGWGWDAGRKGHWQSRLYKRLNQNRQKYIEYETQQAYLYPG